ncbi:MAG: hypothetical protein L0H31_16020, partial [Nocardioidaceae bacterium]|nr:hypothetical protein [Nocardioidaceae bacterium]
LLGSLINADAPERLTVMYDAGGAAQPSPVIAGGQAADLADHPALVAALERCRSLGFLRSA